MSLITDVVVVLDWIMPEDEALLCSPVPGDERQQRLRPIDMEAAGGTKVFCSHVYAAAFNYMADGFEEWVIDILARAGNPVVWLSTEGDNIHVVRPDGVVRGVPESSR